MKNDSWDTIEPGHYLITLNGDSAKVLNVANGLITRSRWWTYDEAGETITIAQAKKAGYMLKTGYKVPMKKQHIEAMLGYEIEIID